MGLVRLMLEYYLQIRCLAMNTLPENISTLFVFGGELCCQIVPKLDT